MSDKPYRNPYHVMNALETAQQALTTQGTSRDAFDALNQLSESDMDSSWRVALDLIASEIDSGSLAEAETGIEALIADVRKVLPRFRLVLIDETHAWNDPGIVEKAGRLYGCYLYDEARHVHAADTNPSYELHFLYNTSANELPEDMQEVLMTTGNDESISYHYCSGIDGTPWSHKHFCGEPCDKGAADYDSLVEAEVEHYRANWALDVPRPVPLSMLLDAVIQEIEAGSGMNVQQAVRFAGMFNDAGPGQPFIKRISGVLSAPGVGDSPQALVEELRKLRDEVKNAPPAASAVPREAAAAGPAPVVSLEFSAKARRSFILERQGFVNDSRRLSLQEMITTAERHMVCARFGAPSDDWAALHRGGSNQATGDSRFLRAVEAINPMLAQAWTAGVEDLYRSYMAFRGLVADRLKDPAFSTANPNGVKLVQHTLSIAASIEDVMTRCAFGNDKLVDQAPNLRAKLARQGLDLDQLRDEACVTAMDNHLVDREASPVESPVVKLEIESLRAFSGEVMAEIERTVKSLTPAAPARTRDDSSPTP